MTSRSSERPPLLFTAGIACLPVVLVLTPYLDQGAWLFASLRSVVVALAIAFAVLGIASLLLRDHVHGALVGLCVFAMLLVYDYPGLLVLIAIVAGLISVHALLRDRGSRAASKLFSIAYQVLGIFGFVLLIVTVVQFGVRGQITGFSATATAGEANPAAPDIYLVLLDGYPRADMLARDWGFTDPGIVAGLEDLGFRVADGARSNYNMTKLTLGSLFSMSLLDEVEPWSGYDRPAYAPPAERAVALQHNRAFDLLRDHGYRITSLSGGYTHEDIRAVDEFISAGTADVVEFHLLGMTAVGEFIQWLVPGFGEGQVAERVESNLDTLERIAREDDERPRFVFAHFPAPHPPYAFATVGRPTVPLEHVFGYQHELFGEELMQEAYRENVAGLNERLLGSMGRIVELAGDEAVIVVMSDHGPRPYGHDELTPDEVESQFSILLAARTPDGEALYPDDALATNVISTVANHHLGTDIPPVDRVFEDNEGNRYPE